MNVHTPQEVIRLNQTYIRDLEITHASHLSKGKMRYANIVAELIEQAKIRIETAKEDMKAMRRKFI